MVEKSRTTSRSSPRLVPFASPAGFGIKDTLMICSQTTTVQRLKTITALIP
jgi:hypothetical protein